MSLLPSTEMRLVSLNLLYTFCEPLHQTPSNLLHPPPIPTSIFSHPMPPRTSSLHQRSILCYTNLSRVHRYFQKNFMFTQKHWLGLIAMIVRILPLPLPLLRGYSILGFVSTWTWLHQSLITFSLIFYVFSDPICCSLTFHIYDTCYCFDLIWPHVSRYCFKFNHP